jgi:hypothetical protein
MGSYKLGLLSSGILSLSFRNSLGETTGENPEFSRPALFVEAALEHSGFSLGVSWRELRKLKEGEFYVMSS